MIRSCLVFPELGLVRVSNCPSRSREFMRQARYRRDMQAFNWQLSETTKNIRKYKHNRFVFLHLFKQVLNKFHIYDTFIGDMILSQLKETPVPIFQQIHLKESNYRIKVGILFSHLKMLGYSDFNINLKVNEFDIEMSFIKSIKYVGAELYEYCRDLYAVLSKKDVKYKWIIIGSHIKHFSPNSTLEDCEFISLMYKYKKHELYLGYFMRLANLSMEENNLIVAWWERVKHSNINNI